MAFGRLVQVTIGQSSTTKSVIVGGSFQATTTTGGGQGQSITDLRMEFKVTKSIGRGAAGPTAELKIYNMSRSSYTAFVKINYFLGIACGYQDELAGGVPLTLFSGAIRFARRYREKADWIVYIEAESGMWNIGAAPYSIGYQPGISVYSMLANLATIQHISIRNLQAVPTSVSFSNGFSFMGRVYDFIDKMCKRIGFNFIIDGGEVTLIPPASVTTTQTVGGFQATTTTPSAPMMQGALLSKETGLLQAPEPEQVSIGVPDETAEQVGGSQTLPEMRWKIDALLMPQVGPGQVMLVKSESFANGQAYMMVEEIEYTGDNRAGDWKMEARCIPVDSAGSQTQVAVA